MALRIARFALRLLFVATLAITGSIASAGPSLAELPYPGPCGCVPNFLECSPSTGWCQRTNGYDSRYPNSCRWNSGTFYTSGSKFDTTCHAKYWRPQV